MGPISRFRRPEGGIAGSTSGSNNDVNTSTTNNNNRSTVNVKYLQEQLKLYSELSKALEQKVEQRNTQIDQLQQKLVKTQTDLDDAQQECDNQASNIQQLEETCVARSSKVSQLVQIIAAKKTSEMQELLLEKSLQVTDLSQDRLKLEQDNMRLEEELALAKVKAAKFKHDRDKNNKLLLELSDIVRTLNTIAIEYEKVDNQSVVEDSESSTSGSSSYLPMNQPLRNVKRKIHAIERDRQRLVQERDELRQDNEAKDEQIAALEASFQLLNDKSRSKSFSQDQDGEDRYEGDVNERRSSGHKQPTWERSSNGESASDHERMEELSREVSFEEYAEEFPEGDERSRDDQSFKEEERSQDDQSTASSEKSRNEPFEENQPDHDSRPIMYTNVAESLSIVQEDVSSHSSSSKSSASSFSTLQEPPPPMVPQQEYDDLHRKFDKALDVIERLRDELSKRIRKDTRGRATGEGGKLASVETDDELQAKEREVASLKRQLDDVSKAKRKLQLDLEESRMDFEKANKENGSIIQELRMELEERRKALEETTHNSDSDLAESKKMNEILKQQYDDLETEYTLKIETLQDKLNMVQKQVVELKEGHQEYVDSLKEEHQRETDARRKSFEDMKLEYDTFLEVHLTAEDDANKEKELYKEALKKIVALESELVEVKDKLTMSAASHHEALAEVKEKKQEAVLKYNKLKQGHETMVVQNAKQMEEAATKYEELQREHAAAVSHYHNQLEELDEKHKELRRDFDNALIEHGKRMQAADFRYEKLKAECDAANENYLEKIKTMKAEEAHRVSESIEKVRRESRDEMEKMLADSKRLLEQQKKQSDREIQSIMESSQKLLQQKEARFLSKIEKIEETKQRSQSQADRDIEKAQKEVGKVKTEAVEMLEKQRSEANAKFLKHQMDAKNDIARLTAENKDLLEHKQEGEDMKVLYRELASSYHSSLVKIEVLLRSLQAKKDEETDTEHETKRKGSVMEKILMLEQQSRNPSKKASGSASIPKRANADPTFQRDFNALLDRIGYDAESESHSEALEKLDDTASHSTMSISLESILAQKDALSHKSNTTTDSSKATSAKKDTSTKEYLLRYDLVRHFVKLKKVNDSVTKPKRSSDPSRKVLALEPANEVWLRQHHSLFSETPKISTIEVVPKAEWSHYDDETSIHSDATSANAVTMARQEAERLQGEKLKQTVYAHTAEIKSQAREKEYRLLQLQFNSIKSKFEQAVQSSSATAASTKHDPPSRIDLKPTVDDASFQLRLALSTVTSDPVAPPHGVHPDISEVDCLRKQLLCAELKVDATKKEMEAYQSHVKKAKKQRDVGNRHLNTVMDHLHHLERSESNISEWNLHPDTGKEEALSSTEGMSSEHSSKASPMDDNQDEQLNSLPVDSIYGDSRNAGMVSCLDDGSEPFRSTFHPPTWLEERDPSVAESIQEVQEELRKAKEEAKMARQKQLEREDNLRDVILQYKKLQKEHENVTTTLREKEEQKPVSIVDIPDDSTSMLGSENLYQELMNEHDTAQVNLQKMQGKITTAQEALRLARERRGDKKIPAHNTDEHAAKREAIAKYKALQEEFMSVLEDKKELEKVLYDQNVEKETTVVAQPSPTENEDSAPAEETAASMSTTVKKDWKRPSRIGSHRGKAATSSDATKPPTEARGKVQQRVMMMEAGLPSPPSNPNSDCSGAGEINSSNKDTSPPQKVKLSRKKRGFSFRGGKGERFVSNLPRFSSSSKGSNATTKTATTTTR